MFLDEVPRQQSSRRVTRNVSDDADGVAGPDVRLVDGHVKVSERGSRVNSVGDRRRSAAIGGVSSSPLSAAERERQRNRDL